VDGDFVLHHATAAPLILVKLQSKVGFRGCGHAALIEAKVSNGPNSTKDHAHPTLTFRSTSPGKEALVHDKPGRSRARSGTWVGMSPTGYKEELTMTTRSKKTTKTAALASSDEISGDAQAPSRVSRREALRNILATEQGASIRELCDSFGWQPHSARAALSGLRKAGTGVARILPATSGGETRYRVVTEVDRKVRNDA
jgi:Protein of unknown function (DUF3489)